ncbi:hypothetical protein IKG28_00840 [Candidatus Saccharibacteria bacterium]|nr:hypothetical protein [Candidatus Saccharibacteria bacterium]
MRKFFDKIFGGLKMSWLTVIIMAVALGIWTALMAMLVPDGNSFHDIVVTPEWWVLPAIIIIVNCKKPLDAALKVFVFFLISQPLVYLIQVPFNSMGWGLFGYYPYWFKITLATLPAGFIGWYMKKDKWYSGVILSFMTVLLVYTGVGYISHWGENFPNHLISVIYCFGIIPVFIFGLFKKWQPQVVTAIITVAVMMVCAFIVKPFGRSKFETYNNTFVSENGITLVGEPFVSTWSADSATGNVEIVSELDGVYMFKLEGEHGANYYFEITDEAGNEYGFTYSWDDGSQSVVVKRAE